MIKKGEININLTTPLPRNASCNKSAIPIPRTTEIKIILPTKVRVFITASNKAGSVRKKS
jgi:hypothetical protein